MGNRKLLEEAGNLGFNLFEKEEPIDTNKILYNVITSEDIRLLEGFPIMLANAIELGGFHYDEILNKLKNTKDKVIFLNIIQLSLAIYKYFRVEFDWKNTILKYLSEKNKNKINVYLSYLKMNRTFNVSKYQISSERIKNIFLNYYKKEENKTREVVRKQKELSLEYALSQIFFPKQRILFKKKLRGEKMTKTEKEYFSRIVKKKIIALSNSELHDMARKILEQG
ncbi:MAG: hypothetical protein P9L90_05705 [Candidatus Aadella gelida]|nr:hypothetical protein [Candidatus Aadella gelida]